MLVWKAAVALAVACYAATQAFPQSEIYGMSSQIRRSSTSIAANIAEGHGRENTGSFIQFLRVAQGSLKELETHLIIAGKVGLMPENAMNALLKDADEIGRMLRSMVDGKEFAKEMMTSTFSFPYSLLAIRYSLSGGSR